MDMRGANNGNYIHGNYFRLAEWHRDVLDKYNCVCQRCSLSKESWMMVSHHIKSKELFPELKFDIENGLCVCRSCHTIIHKTGTHHSEETKLKQKISHFSQRGCSGAKVTEEQVVIIRKLHKDGAKIKELCTEFGLKIRTMRGLINRSTWRWVE